MSICPRTDRASMSDRAAIGLSVRENCKGASDEQVAGRGKNGGDYLLLIVYGQSVLPSR